MLTSTPCTDLLSSLLAARLAFPAITRNCQGFSKRTGKKYNYADLSAIVEATAPILGQHGLLLVQAIEDGDVGTLRVASILFHVASGQWLSSELSVTKPDELQEYGAAATYCKRYGQVALLNLSSAEEDDDAASLNGSSKAEKSAAAEKGRPVEPLNGNGHTSAPPTDSSESPEHPTEGHLAALRNLALTECSEENSVFEDRIRHTLGLKPNASVSPRLMTRVMSMAQYMDLFGYYRRLEAQLAKGKEGTPSGTASTDRAAAQPAPATTEAVPQDPPQSSAEGSSSAPGPEPEDTVESLVAYAMSLGLREDLVRRIIKMHRDLGKCRKIFTEAAARNKLKVA